MVFAGFSEPKRLSNLKRAFKYAGDILNIPALVRLWDGSEIVLSEGEPSLTLSIASPGVVASLLKCPTLDNIVGHYAVGNIAVESGDLIGDLKFIRQRIKKKDVRRLSKIYLLRLLWPFILVKSAKAASKHGFENDDSGASHDNARNQNYIQFHYDVGNDFYRLFLDPEMLYSCAYFKQAQGSLEQAQLDKMEMICRKLRLKPGDRFLDIGCGWGGLICYAAAHYGVKAHGITLSQEQYAFAQEKIRALGLGGRVTVEIRDYRMMEGTFDKIASIGMFEHIGLANFPLYFGKIRSLLSDRGIVLNHGIARRAKSKGKNALTRLTPEKRMILKYIFPGAELAPIGHSLNEMEAQGFEVHDVEAWREHYALTCEHWCRRLFSNKKQAIVMVGQERYNLWLAYLAGVAMGFAAGSILIFQTVASKRSKEKGASGLPLTREELYRK